jgi:phosphoglycerol transferase MdoB-like AlkP superfamily enzyme
MECIYLFLLDIVLSVLFLLDIVLSVLFLLDIVLSVLFLFTASDYIFGMFKLFLRVIVLLALKVLNDRVD